MECLTDWNCQQLRRYTASFMSLLKMVSRQNPIEAEFPADIRVEEKGCVGKDLVDKVGLAGAQQGFKFVS